MPCHVESCLREGVVNLPNRLCRLPPFSCFRRLSQPFDFSPVPDRLESSRNINQLKRCHTDHDSSIHQANQKVQRNHTS